jgi:ribosomal protein S18 acetylase RimI-like enzyme
MMAEDKRADEQTSKRFVIEEVTDVDAAWPLIEPLLLGIVDYHKPWDQRPLRTDWASRARDYMASRGLTLLAKNASGEPVGFMSGFVSRDFGIFEEVYAYMDNAYVRADDRNQGVGTAMLNRFESWCRAQGATELRLDVVAGNELGFGFWTRSGFDVRRYEMVKGLEAPS